VTRRDLIALLGSTAAAWPLAARAQQPMMPVVGFLNSLGSNDRPNLRDAFHRGFGEAGFVPGSNVAIEYRYADNQVQRLPAPGGRSGQPRGGDCRDWRRRFGSGCQGGDHRNSNFACQYRT
jgi:hypothetical protein